MRLDTLLMDATKTPGELPRILCVDDEPQILKSLTMHLRRHYDVVTATSGAEALQQAASGAAPAVVVSDMRMPVMDGAGLLRRMLHAHPETTRILLTGEPSRDSAAAAVNEGQIFRFLTKPCTPADLLAAIDAGVLQHRLVTAEKTLMQETLIGCINALIDVLAITNPVAFGRTNRVKRLAVDLAVALGLPMSWQLEAAAMLSQIGFISLPPELVVKVYDGKRLSAAETALVNRVPAVAQSLLGRIPRIEDVVAILKQSQEIQTSGDLSAPRLATAAQILRVVQAYDGLIASGRSTSAALQILRAGESRYGADLITGLAGLLEARAEPKTIHEMQVNAVKPGMTMMDDLRTSVGTLLVPAGFEVTQTFMERKRNFDSAILQAKVRVTLP